MNRWKRLLVDMIMTWKSLENGWKIDENRQFFLRGALPRTPPGYRPGPRGSTPNLCSYIHWLAVTVAGAVSAERGRTRRVATTIKNI